MLTCWQEKVVTCQNLPGTVLHPGVFPAWIASLLFQQGIENMSYSFLFLPHRAYQSPSPECMVGVPLSICRTLSYWIITSHFHHMNRGVDLKPPPRCPFLVREQCCHDDQEVLWWREDVRLYGPVNTSIQIILGTSLYVHYIFGSWNQVRICITFSSVNKRPIGEAVDFFCFVRMSLHAEATLMAYSECMDSLTATAIGLISKFSDSLLRGNPFSVSFSAEKGY